MSKFSIICTKPSYLDSLSRYNLNFHGILIPCPVNLSRISVMLIFFQQKVQVFKQKLVILIRFSFQHIYVYINFLCLSHVKYKLNGQPRKISLYELSKLPQLQDPLTITNKIIFASIISYQTTQLRNTPFLKCIPKTNKKLMKWM